MNDKKNSSKAARAKQDLILIFSVPVVVLLIGIYVFYSYFIAAASSLGSQQVLFQVAPSMSLRSIAEQLGEKGLIKSKYSFLIFSKFSGDKPVQAGEYQFSYDMNVKQIYRKLTSGDLYKRKIQLIEGETIWSLPDKLVAEELVAKSDFLVALRDRELLDLAGIEAADFEGYLFPDTYFFSRPVTTKDIVLTMAANGSKKWPDSYSERAEQLGMSRHKILTLASIIEKETGSESERKLISSVFHNRLKAGMRLESDPTVIYGLRDTFNGNLTRAHLLHPTLYNTYQIKGLPPGPICNPGLASIEAALFPEQSSFLFFVAKGDGTHAFSSNYEEHQQFVKTYQKTAGGQNTQVPPLLDSSQELQQNPAAVANPAEQPRLPGVGQPLQNNSESEKKQNKLNFQ